MSDEFFRRKKEELRARAEDLAELVGDDVSVSELYRALRSAWLEGVVDGMGLADEAPKVPPAPFRYPAKA